MSFKFLPILLIISVVLLFSVIAWGEDSTVQKEVPVFTNQDVEKYKNPSDSGPRTVRTDRTAEIKEKAQKIKKEREKEYWCKKATQYRKKIEMANDDIAEAEKELSGESSVLSYKKKRVAQDKLNKAKRRLKYAEKDLAEIEEEARRKEIPPGWLRCQFE
ncbi:MAG: hypothetical protein M1508_07400 [Nitrospirae bacterium]|nr:hypothetical protein [Nitrospirota bacterium]MCL5423272.1 hypothetical protein [Nitrospirota bacterium]